MYIPCTDTGSEQAFKIDKLILMFQLCQYQLITNSDITLTIQSTVLQGREVIYVMMLSIALLAPV